LAEGFNFPSTYTALNLRNVLDAAQKFYNVQGTFTGFSDSVFQYDLTDKGKAIEQGKQSRLDLSSLNSSLRGSSSANSFINKPSYGVPLQSALQSPLKLIDWFNARDFWSDFHTELMNSKDLGRAYIKETKDKNTELIDWLNSYKDYAKRADLTSVNLEEELSILCGSILMLAIEYCPKKTGYLSTTAFAQITGSLVTFGFDSPALYVHENLAIVHPDHYDNLQRGYYDCGGGSKFLSNAILQFTGYNPTISEGASPGSLVCIVPIDVLYSVIMGYSQS